MTRRKIIIKYLIVVILAAFAAYRTDSRQTIVDGDTLIVGRERIRMKGIDAPEMTQTCLCQGKETNCGVQAKQALSDFIGKNSVSCKASERDVYGRLLAECFVTFNKEKISLNTLMVRAGMAVVFSKNDETLLYEEAKAIREKKGFWKCERFQMPAEFRKAAQNKRSI